jgi:hypothetical protein
MATREFDFFIANKESQIFLMATKEFPLYFSGWFCLFQTSVQDINKHGETCSAQNSVGTHNIDYFDLSICLFPPQACHAGRAFFMLEEWPHIN